MMARAQAALEARRILERKGHLADGLLDLQVSASWKRCLAAGLDPRGTPQGRMLDPQSLRAQIDRSDYTLRLARVEMESLYHQIAGSNFMIAFGNAEGVVMDTVADPAFAASGAGRQIRPGSVWTEQLAGTNALGTASTTRQALIVHGAEHFYACFDGITCAAAPIVHADGSLAGILDASSFCDAYPAHTLVLVRMAALNVANGLFQREMREHHILELHSRSEFIGSIAAGLIAVDDAGIIRGVNGQTPVLMPGVTLRAALRFEDVFVEDFHSVLVRLHDEPRTTVRDALDRAYTLAWRNPPARGGWLPAGGRDALAPRSEAPSNGNPQVAVRAAAHTRSQRTEPLVAALPPHTIESLVSEDARVGAAMRLVEAAARLPAPILIIGETGTGKEMLARHAHRASRRAGAYVAVNCAAMPAELFEAELFGYSPGAFTGARRDGHPGLLAEADGGTLLLDEIADLPLPLQAALLRFLDDFLVRPVGGRSARRVDPLIIAATNVDLERAVAERRFRADLLYRLNTVQVSLPPLRERSDFQAVAREVLLRIDPHAHIATTALAALARQPWPGNVRELRAVLTRALLMAQGAVIGCEHLGLRAETAVPDPDTLRTLSGALVRRTLDELDGNVSATASRLAISRNTVYRYLRDARHA